MEESVLLPELPPGVGRGAPESQGQIQGAPVLPGVGICVTERILVYGAACSNPGPELNLKAMREMQSSQLQTDCVERAMKNSGCLGVGWQEGLPSPKSAPEKGPILPLNLQRPRINSKEETGCPDLNLDPLAFKVPVLKRWTQLRGHYEPVRGGRGRPSSRGPLGTLQPTSTHES